MASSSTPTVSHPSLQESKEAVRTMLAAGTLQEALETAYFPDNEVPCHMTDADKRAASDWITVDEPPAKVKGTSNTKGSQQTASAPKEAAPVSNPESDIMVTALRDTLHNKNDFCFKRVLSRVVGGWGAWGGSGHFFKP